MSNEKKSTQLGMSYGKAGNILRKEIIFNLIQKCGMDICFQCNSKITSVDQMSIEHKTPWLDSENPIDLYFDMDNIAFSHTTCNYKAARRLETNKIVSKTTGFRGVKINREIFNKDKYRYKARIRANGKDISIGYFNDPIEAAKAYDKKAVELLGDKAITNVGLGLI